MPRLPVLALCVLLPFAAAFGCTYESDINPFLFHLGPVTFRPSGFFEGIAMFRTATTGDTVNTRFGRIPLQNTPAEMLVSAGHSRMQVCGEVENLSVYIETD